MTRVFAATLVACLLLHPIAFAQGKATQPTRPAQAASATGAPDKALMQQVLDAWSTMNTDNVAKYYDQAPGAVFYDIAPVKFVGFKAYAAGVKPEFENLRSLTFTLNDDAVVHRAGALVWGTATVKTVMTDKAGKATNLDCRWTIVWQQKAGAWVITHDHFSAPVETK